METNAVEQIVLAVLSADRTAIGLLGFLAGNWTGYRVSLALDRRREFNEAATDVRLYLLRAIERPDWPDSEPDMLVLDRFEHCLAWWRRKGFRKCWQAQETQRLACYRQDPATGVGQYENLDPMRDAYRRTLSYTTWR